MLKRTFFTIALCFSIKGMANAFVPPLDQIKVHNDYKDGEFEMVIRDLEGYARKYQGKSWLRDDSISLYKHLAVVYTASPETREKGKFYMIGLLRIMPSAEILDMYVSEEVDRIFLRTRQEFMANMRLFGLDSTSINVPSRIAADSGEGKDKSGFSLANAGAGTRQGSQDKQAAGTSSAPQAKSGWGWKATTWTASGVALMAAGASVFYLMNQSANTEKVNTIKVPAKNPN